MRLDYSYMGYTQKTVELIDPLLSGVRTVVDLGAQNDYRHPTLPAPYVKDTYYHNKGYVAFDISGENGSEPYDLSVLHNFPMQYDLVVDAGTSEHVGRGGSFSWEAIYNCWKNKHRLAKTMGFIVSENPKTGNWPGHGFNYYTEGFYKELATLAEYLVISLGEHPAMGNTINGWNVYCVLQKNREEFISLEEFRGCGIRTG